MSREFNGDEDLQNLYADLDEVAAKWERLGVCLGVPYDKLEGFRGRASKVEHYFTRVLERFLRDQKGKDRDHAIDQLVAALKYPGVNQGRLARKIDQNRDEVQLNLRYLLDKLKCCKAHWFFFGLGLKLNHSDLEGFKEDSDDKGVNIYLFEVLNYWLTSDDINLEPPNVNTLTDALTKIDHRNLATTIKLKYSGNGDISTGNLVANNEKVQSQDHPINSPPLPNSNPLALVQTMPTVSHGVNSGLDTQQQQGNGDISAGNLVANNDKVPSQGHPINSPPLINPNPPVPVQTTLTVSHSVNSGLVTQQQQGHQSIARSEVIPCKRWKLDQWLHMKGYGNGGNCTGRNTVIAIVDGGVDIEHCLLSDKFKAKQIDGHNFVPDLDPRTGEPIIDPKTKATVINDKLWYGDKAKDDHGTAVAAIAGGYNYGIAPDSTLYICRIFHDGKPYAHLFHPLKHILEKKNEGWSIDIVCMSLVSEDRSPEVEQLLQELAANGIICIAAAGNDGRYQQGAKFPASDPLVLSVGSLTPPGQESGMNPPDEIDVFAPGEDIVCPTVMSPTSFKLNDGSSFATPMVAGFLSLLIQLVKDSVPTPTDKTLKEYHNIRFLKKLFLNHKLCDHKKLMYVETFLTDLKVHPMDIISNTPNVVSLIKAQIKDFQP